MKAFYLILFSSLTMVGFCQSSSINEIDRLAKKYTDGQAFEFTNSGGTLKATVKIEYNKSSKPCRISLTGSTFSSEPFDILIRELVAEKLRNGYKYNNGLNTLTKGTLYFKYMIYSPSKGPNDVLAMRMFFIENGDTKRSAGEGSSNVDF